jgi:hypothetical protein
LAVACFFVIPAYSSTVEAASFWPGLAFAGAAFLASLILAFRRGAENLATVVIKLAGFLLFGFVIYLRCANA